MSQIQNRIPELPDSGLNSDTVRTYGLLFKEVELVDMMPVSKYVLMVFDALGIITDIQEFDPSYMTEEERNQIEHPTTIAFINLKLYDIFLEANIIATRVFEKPIKEIFNEMFQKDPGFMKELYTNFLNEIQTEPEILN